MKTTMNLLIYGNESYLLKQTLKSRIRELVGEEDPMNTVYYDAIAQGFSLRPVLDEASTLPFFSEHKVVVVQNCTFLTKAGSLPEGEVKELEAFLKQKAKDCTLIFTHDNDNLDTTKKTVKLFQEYGEVVRVKKLEPHAFRSFLEKELKARQLRVTKEAFEELLVRLDDNLSTAYRELEKLSLYGSSLNLEDIEALVSRPLDNELFHLVNALLDKDLKRSLTIWNDMLVLNMEPLSFIGLIASQLRLMYQVTLLNAEGYHRQEMINLLSYGTPTLNVSRINRMLALAGHTPPRRILEILDRLAEFDQKSKIGLLDKRFGFELFLIEATH